MMIPGKLIKRLVASRYLALVFRLYIGGLFIYASMYKISYTVEFAETIASYQIVPFWAVNSLALFMPWLELICGVLLVFGIKSKPAAAAIGGMLVLFTVALFWVLVRKIPIGCGCFSSVEDPVSWLTLVRDLTWIAMTIQIYFFDSALQLERKFLMALREVQP